MKIRILLHLFYIGFCCLTVPVRAQVTLRYTTLAGYIAEFKAGIPGPNTNSFAEPASVELQAFVPCARALLMGNVGEAITCLDAVNYDLYYLDDIHYEKTYLVASERSKGFKGQGTFVVDPGYRRNIVIAAPHPLFEYNTPEASLKIFQEIGARALMVAGTHRCANSAASPCSGTTSVCGIAGPYRVSDAAHMRRNFLHGAHEAALSLPAPPTAFNIHGKESDSLDIVLSDGTTQPGPSSAAVNRLRDSLLSRGVPTGSCNSPYDSGLTLCGTTNTAGRLYNGSRGPCATAASSASGLFLHFELTLTIRNDPSTLIDALREVFPLIRFIRGDCDNDGFVGGSVNDPVFYLNWAFVGGPAPECLAACDVDRDGFVGGSVNDAVYYLNWAFVGGHSPQAPFPDCEPGTGNDLMLGCVTPSPACQ